MHALNLVYNFYHFLESVATSTHICPCSLDIFLLVRNGGSAVQIASSFESGVFDMIVGLLQDAQAYAQSNGLFFMETSAKTATNVNDLFYEIGKDHSLEKHLCDFS